MREVTTNVVMGKLGRQEKAAPWPGDQDREGVELFLASACVADVVRMIEAPGLNHRYLGPLAARLVELGGGFLNGTADVDDGQTYAHSMRRLRERLEEDPAARLTFATHPRTFGRPAKHLITGADDWVVPMVEAEVARLRRGDRAAFRHTVIMRVGRQHDIHPDFRPLLLRVATEDETLACLATAEQGLPTNKGTARTYLLAAVVGPFVDVVMHDADDGTELEAAAWNYAQRTIATLAVDTGSGDLLQVVGAAASLLGLIDTSRALAARQSSAQAHAGVATNTAIAEFVFANLVLLAVKPETALAAGDLQVGSFVLRDFVGRAPVDLPKEAFEAWARGRSARRLLLDLVMITLLADHQRHDLPPLPAADRSEGIRVALRHLETIQQHDLARTAIQAIDGGWQFGEWAGAA